MMVQMKGYTYTPLSQCSCTTKQATTHVSLDSKDVIATYFPHTRRTALADEEKGFEQTTEHHLIKRHCK
jgi:hypothetical protein